MRLVNKVNNIRQYWLNDGLIYERESKITFAQCDKTITCNSYYPTLIVASDCCYIYSHPTLFDNNSNEIFKCEEDFGLEFVLSEGMLCSKKVGIDNRLITLFSKNVSIIAESEVLQYNKIYSINKFILLQNIDQSQIELLSTSSLIKLWTLSFTELTGSEEIGLYSDLVVVGNKLFFYLTNRKYQGIAATYCIDINTGKLIKEISEFTGDVKHFDGMLYTANAEDIEIMNPETFTVEKFNIKSEMDKNDLQRIDYARWVVSDNKLYFGQNFGAHQAKVGVVDLRTMKITDKHVFERKCGSIGTIKVSGNKLYVHTQDETLHIFEI